MTNEPTRSDLTATPELSAITENIKLELGHSAMSRYKIGQNLEEAFNLLGTDQFKIYLSQQLSDCLSSDRHARRYREFFRGIQERAKMDEMTAEEYLTQHPELGVWEKWQKDKKERQEEKDSPLFTPSSKDYNEKEVDYEQRLKNIGTLFENIFGYTFVDETSMEEWDYLFNRLKDDLPLKQYHPNRVAA